MSERFFKISESKIRGIEAVLLEMPFKFAQPISVIWNSAFEEMTEPTAEVSDVATTKKGKK